MVVSGSVKHVLFLDDDPLVRRAVARSAALRGIEVHAVETAAALRAHLAWREPVDAVVCDFNLGEGKNSASLVRRLQGDGVCVVVLTGNVRAAVSELGFSVPVVAKGDMDELFLELGRQVLEREARVR